MEQNRWRSPVLWASIVAQVLGILLLTGVVDTGLSETINQIAAGVMQLLVLAGVLNNPTDRKDW